MTRRQANTDVLVDVTSLISAEEFLLSQNRRDTPEDPFARQCFVEIAQSLIFMSQVHVAHPVLHAPRPEDFGARPYLLRSLMDAGMLRPLCLDSAQQRTAAALEDSAVHDLETVHGLTSMARFVEQTFVCDTAGAGGQEALSSRIHERRRSPARPRPVRPGVITALPDPATATHTSSGSDCRTILADRTIREGDAVSSTTFTAARSTPGAPRRSRPRPRPAHPSGARW